METVVFDGVGFYIKFIREEGDDIEIISVNILESGRILVTYEYKKEIY